MEKCEVCHREVYASEGDFYCDRGCLVNGGETLETIAYIPRPCPSSNHMCEGCLGTGIHVMSNDKCLDCGGRGWIDGKVMLPIDIIEGISQNMGEFKPTIITNSSMSITSIIFKDCPTVTVPVYGNMHHYIDKLLDFDGNLVGMQVWMGKPAVKTNKYSIYIGKRQFVFYKNRWFPNGLRLV